MKLAISTCPNDTFAFHALLNRQIDWQGLEFEIELLDIQQLNDGLLAGRFDIAKASFHAAIRLAPTTVVLPSGSALGFGVGPLVLAARSNTRPDHSWLKEGSVTLCPGLLTTATLLFQMFYGPAILNGQTSVQQVVFSEIMPALQQQTADFGVCIHEGRFTWQEAGLFLVEDLGTRWELETNSPLPLGGIIARRSLSHQQLSTAQSVIRSSIEYGLAHPDETLPTMRHYAQELNDDILMQHVRLYVNEWTVELGSVGRDALNCLTQKAIESGLVNAGDAPLQIFAP